MTSFRPCRRVPRLFGTARTLTLALLLAINGTGVAFGRPLSEKLGAPPGTDTERAREAASRYELGAMSFRNARYREAVANFLAADALVPSAALSYNIALAYDKLMETARALSFYRDYLRRTPEGENADEVLARIRVLELQLMKKGVQQLTVLSDPPGAVVRIEEEPVGRTPWTGEIPPGEHRLTLTRKGHHQATRTVLLPAANAVDVLVRLEPEVAETEVPPVLAEPPHERVVKKHVALSPLPLPEPGPPPPEPSRSTVVPWLTVGAGAAALAASGTFELMRQQAATKAESALNSEQREKREDQVDRYRTTSLVLLGTGGGLVLTGTMFLLFGGSSRDKEPPVSASASAVGCSADGCYGTYEARF